MVAGDFTKTKPLNFVKVTSFFTGRAGASFGWVPGVRIWRGSRRDLK